MKVLFDTNVLVAAFITHGHCAELLEYCIGEHEICIPEFALVELHDKLSKKFRFPPARVLQIETYLKSNSTRVPMTENSVKVCRDPDDDHILSAALQIKADCIISGDADLLILKKYEGIPILNPSNFWKFQKLTKRLAPISGTDLWHRSLAPISGKEPKYIQAL